MALKGLEDKQQHQFLESLQYKTESFDFLLGLEDLTEKVIRVWEESLQAHWSLKCSQAPYLSQDRLTIIRRKNFGVFDERKKLEKLQMQWVIVGMGNQTSLWQYPHNFFLSYCKIWTWMMLQDFILAKIRLKKISFGKHRLNIFCFKNIIIKLKNFQKFKGLYQSSAWPNEKGVKDFFTKKFILMTILYKYQLQEEYTITIKKNP